MYLPHIINLFLAFPYSYVKFKQLVIDNASYGHDRFKFYGTTGESYSTFISVFIWSMLFMIGIGVAFGLLGVLIGVIFGGGDTTALHESAQMASVISDVNSTYIPIDMNHSSLSNDINYSTEEIPESVGAIASLVGILMIYLPFITWYQGFSDGYFSNFVRNFTKLEQASLKGEMRPFKLGLIAAANVLMILFSLGLLYPWAKIRYLRYKLEHTSFACHDYEQFESTGYETGSAVGEEMTDFFDIDIGL